MRLETSQTLELEAVETQKHFVAEDLSLITFHTPVNYQRFVISLYIPGIFFLTCNEWSELLKYPPQPPFFNVCGKN